MSKAHYRVLRTIRYGEWRSVGQKPQCWYDIGLTAREVCRSTGVDSRRTTQALDYLIGRGLVEYRPSQKRYLAIGRHKNTIRGIDR